MVTTAQAAAGTQDYTAASYTRYAKERAAARTASAGAGSYFKTTGGYTGYASGGVSAIKEGPSVQYGGTAKATDYVYLQGVTGTPVSESIKQRSQPSVPSNAVPISPALASKITQQSLRPDVQYYATPENQLVMAYNRNILNPQLTSVDRQAYGTVQSREGTGLNYGGVSVTGVRKSSTSETLLEAGKGAAETIASPFIGAAKFLYYPNIRPGARPLIDVGQERFFRVPNLLADRNVQSTGIALGSIAAISFAPELALPIGAGFTYVGLKTLLSPTATAREKGGAVVSTAGGLLGIYEGGKAVYTRAGSKYVAPEFVFSSEVLAGKSTLPLSSSVPETLARFEQTKIGENIFAAHASPSKLGSEISDIGHRAAKGIEDPGIYVTPRGEASPGFLRVSPSGPSYSFNPFKEISLGIPTVTEFKATGIVRLPSEVISTPGFQGITEYQQNILAGTGKLQITKRSELGQGEITPQKFPSSSDLYVSKQMGKFLTGKETTFIPKGALISEVGTPEIEAVVPVGQRFAYTPQTLLGRVKGFEYYTTFEGTPIALRRADLLVEKGRSVSAPGLSVLSFERVARETSLAESSVSGGRSTSLTRYSYPITSSEAATSSSLGRALQSSALIISSPRVFSSSLGYSSVAPSVSYPSFFSRGSSLGSSSLLGTPSSSVLGPSSSSVASVLSRPSGVSSSPLSTSSFLAYPSGVSQLAGPYRFFRTERKRKVKERRVVSRPRPGFFFALPDLRSVSVTEAALGPGRRAVAPRLTPGVRGLAEAAFRGFSTGFVPTEQIRRGKVKLPRMVLL